MGYGWIGSPALCTLEWGDFKATDRREALFRILPVWTVMLKRTIDSPWLPLPPCFQHQPLLTWPADNIQYKQGKFQQQTLSDSTGRRKWHVHFHNILLKFHSTNLIGKQCLFIVKQKNNNPRLQNHILGQFIAVKEENRWIIFHEHISKEAGNCYWLLVWLYTNMEREKEAGESYLSPSSKEHKSVLPRHFLTCFLPWLGLLPRDAREHSSRGLDQTELISCPPELPFYLHPAATEL